MAGFREFVTGEILTAANVDDFLAKQVVQKYADAAARDAALGTAVAGGNALREGMVAYLDDEDEVQYFDGTVWDAISQPIAGIGSNVVQTVKTDAFSASVARGASTAITGLTATITPSSDTSKVLVRAMITTARGANAPGMYFYLQKGGSTILQGDADGSRVRVTTGGHAEFGQASPLTSVYIEFLDSPGVATPVTYSVNIGHDRTSTDTIVVNRSFGDTNANQFARATSTMTLVEVAG